MLKPVECVSLHCDRCDAQFEDGDYSIFGDGWDVLQSAHDSEWFISEQQDKEEFGDNEFPQGHWCPACHVAIYDDEDRMTATITPLPAAHSFLKDARYTMAPGAGWTCKAPDCGLRFDHEIHRAG